MNLPLIRELYRQYEADLREVRRYQRRLYKERCVPHHEKSLPTRAVRKVLRKLGVPQTESATMNPQLDDVCAELTYLLVRQTRPQTIVEMSPCGGWSTCWLLHGLRDNGQGRLFSYDQIDLARRHVPGDLANGRWSFYQGDVTKTLQQQPSQIDYLFIDSDHSADFARWYTKTILEHLSPGTPVSVDDVFHSADPGSFGGEGRVIVDWLDKREIRYFTPAPAKDPGSYSGIVQTRQAHRFGTPIHRSTANSTIFFSV